MKQVHSCSILLLLLQWCPCDRSICICICVIGADVFPFMLDPAASPAAIVPLCWSMPHSLLRYPFNSIVINIIISKSLKKIMVNHAVLMINHRQPHGSHHENALRQQHHHHPQPIFAAVVLATNLTIS